MSSLEPIQADETKTTLSDLAGIAYLSGSFLIEKLQTCSIQPYVQVPINVTNVLLGNGIYFSQRSDDRITRLLDSIVES